MSNEAVGDGIPKPCPEVYCNLVLGGKPRIREGSVLAPPISGPTTSLVNKAACTTVAERCAVMHRELPELGTEWAEQRGGAELTTCPWSPPWAVS